MSKALSISLAVAESNTTYLVIVLFFLLQKNVIKTKKKLG